jgi:hypothetical protein
MTAIPGSNRPQSNDVVLGGDQPLPLQSAVLGGDAALPKRFPQLALAEQQASILTLVEYGEAGLQQIINCLQSPSVGLRRMAYELLEMRSEPITQQAIAPGFPLYRGDVVYQVYESVIGYDDEGYLLLRSLEEMLGYAKAPLLGQFVDPSSAQVFLARQHELSAVRDCILDTPYLFRTARFSDNVDYLGFPNWDFPMRDWCRTYKIPVPEFGESQTAYTARFGRISPKFSKIPAVNQWFLRELAYQSHLEPDEYDSKVDMVMRVLEFLIASQQHDLMAQLWLDMVGPLAFIHEESSVSQITYYDLQPDGSIIVR